MRTRLLILALPVSILATPTAQAQVAGRVSIDSQYRSRGYQVTESSPVFTAAVSYDDRSGIYASGVVIAGAQGSEIGVAGYEATIGYATRVTRALSIEVGVQRTAYARRASGPLRLAYTELYAGLTFRAVTARVYYAPDYLRPGRRTFYAEVEGSVRLLPKLNFNAHLGALTDLGTPLPNNARTRIDWRATVSRSFGPFEVYAALSGRGPGADYYARSKGRAVATFGAAFAF
ncbi:MAG: TorF family putative porin [Sphingomonas sp.]